jgi:hypothetical protein
MAAAIRRARQCGPLIRGGGSIQELTWWDNLENTSWNSMERALKVGQSK